MRAPDRRAAGPTAVKIRDVAFSYGAETVLDGVDFTLEAGDFCAVVGANGTGKSTFARIVLGELAPGRGTVEVFGRDPRRPDALRAVGVVHQRAPIDYAHFPATVYEVVRSGLYRATAPFAPYRAEHRSAVAQVLQAAGLEGLEGRLVGELSGGQFQRMLLARALVADPRLIVLDEPTSNLDDDSAAALVRTAAQAAHDGAAVLMITHDTARLPALFGRIAVLEGKTLHDERGRAASRPPQPAPADAGPLPRRPQPDRPCDAPRACR